MQICAAFGCLAGRTQKRKPSGATRGAPATTAPPPAISTAANFYWDYYYIGSAIEPPYAFTIETGEDTPLGDHILQVESPLYAEGKTAATSVVTFRVRVVADASDIPTGGEQSFVVHPRTSTTAEK